MGPITLFDKSFIQMLNIDEAAIFDVLYNSNICPIYFVEVLGDLSKDETVDSPEKIVGDIARKTPILNASPNVFHLELALGELLGNRIEMREVPAIGGARPVRYEGKAGVVYEESPESKAFSRWQDQRFSDLEREFASRWRTQVLATDNRAAARIAREALRIQHAPKSLDEALAIAKEAVGSVRNRYATLKAAYSLLGLPNSYWEGVREYWKEVGGPPISEFAPYASHCLLVDTFFYVCVDKGLIAGERASNRIDMAYLYYLPFTMMFVSNDRLHRRTAPMFMNERQQFVYGEDVKKDLAQLDRYYSALPDSQKEEGLFRLAAYPPNDDRFLATRLHRQYGMAMRPTSKDPTEIGREAKEKILARSRGISEAPPVPLDELSPDELRNPEGIVIKRRVPLHRGKWRILPPGVEKQGDEQGSEETPT